MRTIRKGPEAFPKRRAVKPRPRVERGLSAKKNQSAARRKIEKQEDHGLAKLFNIITASCVIAVIAHEAQKSEKVQEVITRAEELRNELRMTEQDFQSSEYRGLDWAEVETALREIQAARARRQDDGMEKMSNAMALLGEGIEVEQAKRAYVQKYLDLMRFLHDNLSYMYAFDSSLLFGDQEEVKEAIASGEVREILLAEATQKVPLFPYIKISYSNDSGYASYRLKVTPENYYGLSFEYDFESPADLPAILVEIEKQVEEKYRELVAEGQIDESALASL